MGTDLTDWFGYGASFFIVLSFALKNITQIRIVNLIGCILFVIYGFSSATFLWPVIIPNGILCLIQVYHLLKKS